MSSARELKRPVPRLALQRSEAAAALGMSVEHFDEHVKPDVPCVYSGRLRLYPVAALEDWLARSAVPVGRRAA